ncbi:MAG: ORF6N domain-containing protein [Clostridia bacterium]|nr:ORF6N domain-containing protein [Clostridia bacterium]
MNQKLDVIEYKVQNIKDLIYTIRGKQVMLDSDVAMLYKTETRRINQTAKRNIERFPKKFCFKLTEQEFENLKSQFVISSLKSKNLYGGRRKLPLVFTEQGIAMLSGLLKNDIAIEVSIKIMDAFVEMRRFIYNNSNILGRLSIVEDEVLKLNKKFNQTFDEIFKKEETEFKQKIFFNGQIYDSYNLIIDIIKKAKTKILIIDNYIDDSILKMLSKKNKNVEVIILTSQNCNLNKLDIKKFNLQYPSLKISYTNKFHDRFIIIDNKELYHCGASLKDLGKKCFAISKIEDMEYAEKMSRFS